MKQIAFILILFSGFVFVACNNSASDSLETKTEYPVLSQPTNQELTQPNNSNPTAVKLNPAHGEPGHRCDIAVGAPLNSSPSSTNTSTQSLNNSLPVLPATLTQQPIQQTTASGLNPEHGKPGHRCDIAVGEPLNSKPSSPTTATPTINTSTVSTPVNVAQSNTEEKVAPGMNPKHGQPGHRCDIAVGAPLNSKPAQSPLPPPPPSLPVIPVKPDSAKN
ncbi:MAG TPA: hypothetical protein VI548_08370 [Chitinophagaceae bacterium]|nr:hypothetical protein [Chitinophagaceae bacterium]